MMTKQMTFAVIIFISMNNVIFSTPEISQKDFAFKRKMHTQINGNSAFDYIYSGRHQDNPSYVFKYTRILACTKDKKLTEVGTLESFEKAYREKYSEYRSEAILTDLNNFEEFGNMNTAIYCADLEQKLNYFDELENVGAIVYGTRDVKDCALVREYLAKKNAAENKTRQK